MAELASSLVTTQALAKARVTPSAASRDDAECQVALIRDSENAHERRVSAARCDGDSEYGRMPLL